MIELLVKAKSTHGSYLKGHVIDVKEMPCPWGKKECLPLFLRIKIDANMEHVQHLKSEQLMRSYDVAQVGLDQVITIKNVPQLTKADFEEVKETLLGEVQSVGNFTVQTDKLIFRSDSEVEHIKALLHDVMETQYLAKRYRIKSAVMDDLIKSAKNSTIQITLQQLTQSLEDDKIEVISIS